MKDASYRKIARLRSGSFLLCLFSKGTAFLLQKGGDLWNRESLSSASSWKTPTRFLSSTTFSTSTENRSSGGWASPTGIGASTSSVSPWMRRRTGSAPCPARSDGCPASPQKPPTPTMFSKTKVTL